LKLVNTFFLVEDLLLYNHGAAAVVTEQHGSAYSKTAKNGGNRTNPLSALAEKYYIIFLTLKASSKFTRAPITEACVNNVRAGRADFGAKQGTRSAA
jgi:hypothetical protein